MICLSNIDDEHFVTECECCGEVFVTKDYGSFCSFCSPMMEQIEQEALAAIEMAIQDDESYQEYLREHAS